jgi:hypothetical protein
LHLSFYYCTFHFNNSSPILKNYALRQTNCALHVEFSFPPRPKEATS